MYARFFHRNLWNFLIKKGSRESFAKEECEEVRNDWKGSQLSGRLQIKPFKCKFPCLTSTRHESFHQTVSTSAVAECLRPANRCESARQNKTANWWFLPLLAVVKQQNIFALVLVFPAPSTVRQQEKNMLGKHSVKAKIKSFVRWKIVCELFRYEGAALPSSPRF